MSVKKAIEFECNDENVRNVLVISFVDNGAKSLLESLSYKEGYPIEDDFFGHFDIYTFSTIHEYENREYLINLTNIPYYFIKNHEYLLGLADTCLIVISSTEVEVMEKYTPIIKSVVENRIKPILLINKLDLLAELFRDDIEQLLIRLAYIMKKTNMLIEDETGNDEWSIEVEKDNVIFGSATHGWGYNRKVSSSTGIKFKEIDETLKNSIYTDLHERIPIGNAVFDSIIENSPVVSESLEYRLPIILKNDIDTSMVQSMANQDSDGSLIAMFFGIKNSEWASEKIYCRIFSGTLKKGDEIHLMGSDEKITVIQTFIYRGPNKLACNEIPAGKMGTIVTDGDVCFGEIYVHL
jgi:elongation factor 2